MVAVVSRKGGTGKSMLAAALATRLAARRKRVVLIDMCSGMRCLDMRLGLESRIVFDLGDVVEGLCGLDKALVRDRRTGVQLLAARQAGEYRPREERTLQILLEVLCLQNDYVIIDTPGGIMPEQALAMRAADTLLLLATPDDLGLRDAEAAYQQLRAMGKTPRLVINRIIPAYVAQGLQYAPDTCAQVLDLPVLGVIPEDEQAQRCVLAIQPGLDGTKSASAIDHLIARLNDPALALRPWQTETAARVAPWLPPRPPVADVTGTADMPEVAEAMPERAPELTLDISSADVLAVDALAAADVLVEAVTDDVAEPDSERPDASPAIADAVHDGPSEEAAQPTIEETPHALPWPDMPVVETVNSVPGDHPTVDRSGATPVASDPIEAPEEAADAEAAGTATIPETDTYSEPPDDIVPPDPPPAPTPLTTPDVANSEAADDPLAKDDPSKPWMGYVPFKEPRRGLLSWLRGDK